MMKRAIILMALVIISLSSCDDNEALKAEMIETELALKINSYRQKLKRQCQDEALIKAEMIVDSLLLLDDRDTRLSNAYRPEVPPKPTYISTDSLRQNSQSSVKPITKDFLDRK